MIQLFTYQEAADLLRIGKSTLELRVYEGKVETCHLGGCVRFTMSALEKYVADSSKTKTRKRKAKK